jgi:hypothetical protein
VSFRDDLIAALDGGEPEVTPLAVWHRLLRAEEESSYRPLLEAGLGLARRVPTVSRLRPQVEQQTLARQQDGRVCSIERWKTPLGTLQESWAGGERMELFVKSPQDYKALQWVAERTEPKANYGSFEQIDRDLGPHGLAVVHGGRSPAMRIAIDWAGIERFYQDLAMAVEELHGLYEALKSLFIEESRLIAAGPGRYVLWPEKVNIGILGPVGYDRLLAPVYGTCAALLEQGGKRAMVRYDGTLSLLKTPIARAPFRIIESLSEPPAGDMTYRQCRAAWPDKALWGRLDPDLFDLPPEQLAREVIGKRERAGKRGFAFEVSEELPANWRDALPVVLDTLRELR